MRSFGLHNWLNLSLTLFLMTSVWADAPLHAQNVPVPVPAATPPPPIAAQSSPASAAPSPDNLSGMTGLGTSFGHAALPAASAQPQAPAGSGSENDNTVYLENADLLHLGKDDVANLTGHVEVRYRNFTLRSDAATIDTINSIASFTGHVSIVSSDDVTSIVSASPTSQITVDLKNGSYVVVGPAHAVISPSDLSGSGLILPLLIDSNGFTSSNGIIDARECGFTTCDFSPPHYYFGVRSLTIYPGKKLIARHATLYRRGVPIVELSYVAVPLYDRYTRASYFPTVGDDPTEGEYVKFAYPYVLSDAALGFLRLDFMQFLGVGYGFVQSYDAHGPNGGGTFSVYSLDDKARDQNTLTDSLTHNQTIGDYQVGLTSQFENDSYLSSIGTSQSMTNQVTVSRSSPSSSTSLIGNFQQSNYGSGATSNISAALNQQNTIAKNDTADVKLNFAGFVAPGFAGQASSGSDVTESLASTLALHFQPTGLHVDVETDLFTPLQNTSGEAIASTAGVLREPEILLTTSGTGGDPLDMLARQVRGSQIQLGMGLYNEAISNTDTSRLFFSYNEGTHTHTAGPVTTSSQASYQQMFYGDGGAQYTLNGNYGSDYKHGPYDLSADYSTLRVYGYTPFLFDRAAESNTASFNATLHPNRALDITASSAYDFLEDRSIDGLPAAPWANLLGVINYHPSGDLANRLQATYDPNHGELFDLTNDLQLRSSSGFNFHASVDYLPEQSKVGTVNGTLDLPIITDKSEQAGYRIQALAGYNGYDDQFTYQGVSVTRSWHDWEMTATYQYSPTGLTPGNSFSFTFHLKALPGYQPFGIGSYGQELGGGVGQVF